MLELLDGTLLVPLQLRDGEGTDAIVDQREAPVAVLRSTNGGKTWRHITEICGLVGQTRMLRLESGKLLACVFKVKAGIVKKLFLAESNDDGGTWIAKCEVMTRFNPGGANLTQLVDGTVVLQFLHDVAPGKNPNNDWYSIDGVHAVVSRDEGRTWEKEMYVIGCQIPTGAGAYLSDGSILTTCVHDVGSGMRFQAVTWRPLTKSLEMK